MSESAKQRYKKIAKAFDYVGKIISSALFNISLGWRAEIPYFIMFSPF